MDRSEKGMAQNYLKKGRAPLLGEQRHKPTHREVDKTNGTLL